MTINNIILVVNVVYSNKITPASLPKSRVDDCAEVPPTADSLDQAHDKLVHAAGETSASVNSKAVT